MTYKSHPFIFSLIFFPLWFDKKGKMNFFFRFRDKSNFNFFEEGCVAGWLNFIYSHTYYSTFAHYYHLFKWKTHLFWSGITLCALIFFFFDLSIKIWGSLASLVFHERKHFLCSLELKNATIGVVFLFLPLKPRNIFFFLHWDYYWTIRWPVRSWNQDIYSL